MTENHLIFEKSPYLLQHAHNPVQWYPWGKEAFAKAVAEDKPVFLSIGYSTCHWCHVMAHESFEDEEVAAVLNTRFISVKVDREERPDVDAVYMAVCQALTGSGGWPLTVFMNAEQTPFFVGTYFPKHARFGQSGLYDLLVSVSRQWQSNRSQLLEEGAGLMQHLSVSPTSAATKKEPDKALLKSGISLFSHMFDIKNGGFGAAPKFPTPHNLLFLMRYARLEQDECALTMPFLTLTQMARGGLFDHIGGGFSRYSTDGKWLVPHFEKMLYDNALLAYAYTTASVEYGSAYFRQIAERTLLYVLRELTDAEGAFYCGQDADSEGVEGKYYVFSPEEIGTVLGDADGAWFCRMYDITKIGNFESMNIPNLLKTANYEESFEKTQTLLNKLYAYRKERAALHRDDKVLTSWNALMIGTLCHAASLFDNAVYLQAAKRAAAFIENNLTDAGGKLYLRWREGEKKQDGHIDDYAFYALALLSLYQSTFDVRYLLRAAKISGLMLSLFFDEMAGGFYLYASDSEQLILRPKEVYDGAAPSGNAVAALVLGRLFRLTGDQRWQIAYEKQLSFLAGCIRDYPAGHTFSLYAFTETLYPSFELVCTAADASAAKPLLHALKGDEIPNISVLVKTLENAKDLASLAPWTLAYPLPSKGAVYYLCQNGACQTPTDDIDTVLAMLHKKE